MDIVGDHTNETLTGSSGDDTIQGMAGDDVLSGLGGNDSLEGDAGSDTLYGGEGNDVLEGSANPDLLDGGDGDDTLLGSAGDDTISAGGGEDVMDGDAGNDSIEGGTGNDAMSGSAGNDTMHGGAGDDTINGDTGEAGNDLLYGEDGNDTMNGSAGMDLLDGGAGDDEMTGGDGVDTFVFNFEVSGSTSTQTVTAWFRDGNKPASISDYSAWRAYDTQLDVWRAEMSVLHGADLESGNTYGLDIKVSGTSGKKPITTTYHFDGDSSYKYTETLTTLTVEGGGYDVVNDWTADMDQLVLNGLSNVATDDNYWAKVLTVDTNVLDLQTVFSFQGGSITLVGVDTTMQALIDAGQVTFG
jgi:hypothetical protein